MSKHPNNSQTFSKPTIKKPHSVAPSPGKQLATHAQTVLGSAWGRRFRELFNKDKDAWHKEHFGKKDE
jgi:hypothetical protein